MIKKITLFLFCISFLGSAYAQKYNTQKLSVVAKIWGECYLFHPSVIRADQEINWEKQLVDFLPLLEEANSNEKFISLINSNLLEGLNDPLTQVQKPQQANINSISEIKTSENFDYLKIPTENFLNMSGLDFLESKITDKNSSKPLVIDCRISTPLEIDFHTYTPFHFMTSMLINEKITLSSSISREHFGWDEYNDWWFYEQRWKISHDDIQQKNNNYLFPVKSYQEELSQYELNFNLEKFIPITRPIYFVVNKDFLSYYYSLVQSIQSNRENTFVILENSGHVYSDIHNINKYDFSDFEFTLNNSYYCNHASTGLGDILIVSKISLFEIENFIKSTSQKTNSKSDFSLEISPKKYSNITSELTIEEKILGIIKTWTIVKYFYPYINECSINWEESLNKYLELAQETKSDKEYYLLIQEMMASLNDSHVSTYHSSILDFSKIFVVPIQFEWIEDKVIITAIDSSIHANINIGDEIIAIDNRTIEEIIKEESKFISSSNNQGLISTIFNTAYFVGEEGKNIKYEIISKGKQNTVNLPRTKYVFEFMGKDDTRKGSNIFDKNIGYLNLASLTNTSDLESKLFQMSNTDALILDLRNSYPTADYQHFLQMLCQSELTIRQSEVPIITAKREKTWQFSKSHISPIETFSYDKPIFVLIDKSMISRPEDIAVALKSLPNTIFVGEQTQGTNGEMTKIHLPGGGETSFTGQKIKFGDGSEFQHIGIIPDIKVERSISGVISNKDEILEKAIEIANSK